MNFLDKFKSAAKSSFNALASVAADISSTINNANAASSSPDSNSANSNTDGINAGSANNGNANASTSSSYEGSTYNMRKKSSHAELLSLFHAVCATIDGLADPPEPSSTNSKSIYIHPNSPAADRALYESSARANLRALIQLLKKESDDWFDRYGERPDPEIVELPCLDTFLNSHVLQALCNRASRDSPRGTLPLILGAVASLLRNVKYPLLPHQTINKPVAHLVSVASRYEALFSHNVSGDALTDTEQSEAENINYKKRIGD